MVPDDVSVRDTVHYSPYARFSRRRGESTISAVTVPRFYLTYLIRLGNGEVTKAQACAAACIDPKAFDTTLSIIEDVLRTAPSPQHNQRSITFRSLSKTYVAREDAYVPMVEVEEALKACGILVDGAQIDLGSPVMQCAIFYWVCTAILQVSITFCSIQCMT
jgi:hypothetical protein